MTEKNIGGASAKQIILGATVVGGATYALSPNLHGVEGAAIGFGIGLVSTMASRYVGDLAAYTFEKIGVKNIFSGLTAIALGFGTAGISAYKLQEFAGNHLNNDKNKTEVQKTSYIPNKTSAAYIM